MSCIISSAEILPFICICVRAILTEFSLSAVMPYAEPASTMVRIFAAAVSAFSPILTHARAMGSSSFVS